MQDARTTRKMQEGWWTQKNAGKPGKAYIPVFVSKMVDILTQGINIRGFIIFGILLHFEK